MKIVIIVFLLIFLIFLFIPIIIVIDYDSKKNYILEIKINLLSHKGLNLIVIKYLGKTKKEIKVLYLFKFRKNINPSKNIKSKIEELIEIYSQVKTNVINLKHSTKLIKFKLDVIIGCNNAASTAMIYGLINSVIYSLLGVLYNYSDPKKFKVTIVPDFNKEKKDIKFSCIILTRLAYIIIAGIKTFLIHKKL
ncbi:DUF2953 domain-containing protein [Abyssisolibacter fermentans]|uniref:DUF2953 domain-containing protein n=1 Tax=Abyssisolibacter fermentans TaxID=1766203 RepID=UPI00082D3BB9|nr:DUF2953 domain-containing protein [Abyssisolibacter fermentans]